MVLYKLFILGAIIFMKFDTLLAEPWIANRFAQNCAGCHAPGRQNLPASQRRCTLSCQGCHVNPNGGGLRDFYGKWNENRWLRSFPVKKYLADHRHPQPLNEQYYASSSKSKKKLPRKMSATFENVDEKLYDKYHDTQHEMLTKDRSQWLKNIPQEDPYRQLKQSHVDGGADFRYQLANFTSTSEIEGATTESKFDEMWFMTADVSLRWRPMHKKVHLVIENRYQGIPGQQKMRDWLKNFNRRSLYLKVDDLPYNLYSMIGIYRPFIGNASADHTSLFETLKSIALTESPAGYDYNFETVSIGGSPNVPFANVHLIGSQYRSGEVNNKSNKGIAFNLGGRFVTLGLSPTYSFWYSIKNLPEDSETEATTMINSLNVGAQIWRLTLNADIMHIKKDVGDFAQISATYMGIETYLQLWRHIYGFSSLSYANITKALEPGTTTQMRFGLRGFIIPGVDLSLAYSLEFDTTDANELNPERKLDESGFLAQLHLYL